MKKILLLLLLPILMMGQVKIQPAQINTKNFPLTGVSTTDTPTGNYPKQIANVEYVNSKIGKPDEVDGLISLVEPIINGLNLQIPASTVSWRISGTTYTNATTFNFTIPAATSGMYRTDVIVGSSSGFLSKIAGTESANVTTKPTIPDGMIELTSIDVFGSTLVTLPTTPTGFIKESEGGHFHVYGSGDLGMITFPNEYAHPYFVGGDSMDGIRVDAKNLREGKDYYFRNFTGHNFTLNAWDGIVNDGIRFYPDNIVIPNHGIAHLIFTRNGTNSNDGFLLLVGTTAEKGDQGIQGIQGEKGDKGDIGLQGVKGDTGNDGYTPIKGVDYFDGLKGDKGDKGDTGNAGVDGKSVSIKGSFTNISQLPAVGLEGDSYLIAGDLYVWNGSSWIDVGVIQGPKGDKGDSGDLVFTNIDNTADLDKPISTATQTALDGKVDKVAGKSLISVSEITRLAGVTNTDESNLVHKTGDENIDGVKQFNSEIKVGNVQGSNIRAVGVSVSRAISVDNITKGHSFEESSALTLAKDNGSWGMYDAIPTMYSTSFKPGHFNAYQARQIYSGSGNFYNDWPENGMVGFYSNMVINGTGIVSNVAGVRILNTLVSNAGTLLNQYGIYISNQTAGSIKNYGMWNDTYGNYIKALSIGSDIVDANNALNITGNAKISGTITGGSFIKSGGTSDQALMADGGVASFSSKEPAFSKNTAFNKPFGTTLGTVVQGGTLGTNAYSSTPYLPLTGGVLSGSLGIDKNPTEKIDVEGNIKASGSVKSGYGYYMIDPNHSIKAVAGEGVYISTYLVPNGIFLQQETGNVGLNQPNPTEKLDVGGNIKASGTVQLSPATSDNQAVTRGQMNTAIAAVSSRPYKVYTALLSQTGTDAPVASVLENTLGGTVVWTRVSAGNYTATLSSKFTLGRTVGFITLSTNIAGYKAYISNPTVNTVMLMSTNSSGTVSEMPATSASIEIRVY